MTKFTDEQADAFMQRMSDTLKTLDVPACIAMSYGEHKFYIENELMQDLDSKEKDIAYAGMNVALVNGLLNTTQIL